MFLPAGGRTGKAGIEEALRLRQQRGMQCMPSPDGPPWARQALRDSEGQLWLRLDLAQLAQAERFLDAGYAGTATGKDEY